MSTPAWLKQPESEGKEKHVPVIIVEKACCDPAADVVRVVVGHEVPHPNTDAHHIVWVQLFGEKANGQVIDLGRMDFTPVYVEPQARFRVNNIADFVKLHALAYCNLHGVWANTQQR